MKKIILVLLLASFNLAGQSVENHFFLRPSVKFGMMFSGVTAWKFTAAFREESIFTIYPNICAGISIETKDIINVADAYMSFALEVSYGYAETDKVKVAATTAEMRISSLPVLLWTKLKTPGRISPFLRIGLGTEKSEYRETYYDKPEYGYKDDKWFFCYGIGGGIDFNFFNRLKLSLFGDFITKEKGFIVEVYEPYYNRGSYDYRIANIFFGLSVGYEF